MRILAADDDLVSRLAMEDVLRRCGAPEVVLAEDGADAWQRINGDQYFDLVCLDVRMPPPDGLELVARLRAAPALKRVPAMLITSTADRDTVLRATRSDLQGFIVKPVGPDTVGRIQRVLALLDAGILEPVGAATARLRVDADRHARYVGAFRQQIQSLRGLAQELASAAAGSQVRTAFLQKADACRTAALTLGSPRLEQLISDALALLAACKPGAERAMGQACYWLERVSQTRPD
jgi:CheY-like chemotaxis protein